MYKNKFYQKDILSADQFHRQDIENVFRIATEIEKIVHRHGHVDVLKGKVMTALFYEPSSRTFSSFVTAMQRLGGGFVPIHGISNSSVAKGETLADTIRTFAKYADVIVMRHPEKGAAKIAAHYSDRPIINAGDGIGEHPTQALLDMFTIYKRHKNIDGLTITMVGDMKNGRTVHSLSRLLSNFNSITINFVSPRELRPSPDLIKKLRSHKLKVNVYEDLKNVLAKTDVLYVTRVQKERFKDLSLYEKLKHRYIISPKELSIMKSTAIVMHPFPRIGEISELVDKDPRAIYIKEQMENGMYVRMTLLTLVLRKEDITSFFTDDIFIDMSSKAVHTDPIYTYKLYSQSKKRDNDYYLAKSLGTESFHISTAKMSLKDYKRMYLEMLFPHMLPESKSALSINEHSYQLKHGESGRTTSHIYLNHRIPLFNDIWDKKLLVRLFELFIHENVLQKGSQYGLVAIPSSSSPELTSAIHEDSPHSTSKVVMLPKNIINKEKGTHEAVYGNIDINLPWLFIDDVFTSGETLKSSLDGFNRHIHQKGKSMPKYGVTLVNRNPSTAKKFTQETGMQILSLITLDDILIYHWKNLSDLQKKLIKAERHL